MIGLWVVLAVLVVGLATGALLRRRDGRISRGRADALPAPVAEAVDATTPVTLVQLSTTFCAPCRQTRAMLSDLAERTDGLHHVDLDITHRTEVAEELGVLRTPTTLALDPRGRELLRISGVPKAPELLSALEDHLPRTVAD